MVRVTIDGPGIILPRWRLVLDSEERVMVEELKKIITERDTELKTGGFYLAQPTPGAAPPTRVDRMTRVEDIPCDADGTIKMIVALSP